MTPIKLRGLRKHFGKTIAVDGIDLDIEAGDLFFLLGPSGCGKTTLLRMLAGFTEPTDGRIQFGSEDVTHSPPNKRNTGMVFQGYALWPHMTVAQNVAFGLDVRKTGSAEKKKRVATALKRVQMEEYAGRKPNQLSGGQQQRVALARALVVEPTVLLLDEPLSNLDAKLRSEMRRSIRKICKDAGITAVYVTHDQKEALSMADGMVVLKDGKVMQAGEPREIYNRPRSRFVADFLGETNFLPATIISRTDDEAVIETPAGPIVSTVFPDNLPTKGNVTCSIRPEAVRLLRNGEFEAAEHAREDDAQGRPTNHFTADHDDATYLGEIAQHHFQLPGNITLTAYELNPRPTDPDTRQHITFAPEDVVILAD